MANRILINNIEIDRRSSSQSESKDNTMFYRKFSFLGKDTLNISFPVSIKLKEDIEISLINNFDNHNLPFDPNNLDGLTLEETTSIIGNSIDTVEVNAPTGLKHASIFVEDFVKWVTNPKSSLDLKSGVVTVLSGASPRGGKSYTGWLSGYGYGDPKGYLQINNKFVKALSVNGSGFEKLDIEGKEYSFTKNTVVTRDDVEAHVLAHTTWATTATIDTTATLNGLTVEYSKSTGITDGEKITATVKAPTNGDLLNGGTTDFVISDITIANPARTVTQADVDTYVQANLTWSGSPLVAHIDFTKWAMAGTKLSSPDTTWAEGDHTFTVTALPGYTVNGGASADFTVTLTPKPKWADDIYLIGDYGTHAYKFNGDGKSLASGSRGNSTGFGYGYVSYKTGDVWAQVTSTAFKNWTRTSDNINTGNSIKPDGTLATTGEIYYKDGRYLHTSNNELYVDGTKYSDDGQKVYGAGWGPNGEIYYVALESYSFYLYKDKVKLPTELESFDQYGNIVLDFSPSGKCYYRGSGFDHYDIFTATKISQSIYSYAYYWGIDDKLYWIQSGYRNENTFYIDDVKQSTPGIEHAIGIIGANAFGRKTGNWL